MIMMIMETQDPPNESDTSDLGQFLTCIVKSRGAFQLLLIGCLLSFGIGSVVAIIPGILATRYAIFHGFDSSESCDNHVVKPPACAAGSEEAQSAAAFWNFVSKGLTLLFNPVLGSVSDQGRRPILLSGLFLSCLPATVFVLFIKIPSLHPFWFNVSSCLIGIVDIISIMFACLSDIFPVRFRAAGFGLLMSAFYGGFAFAPSLTLLLDAEQLAVTSLVLIMASLVTAFLFMPETLSDEMRLANEVQRFEQSAQHETNGWFDSSVYVIKRPLREMSILRRSRSLQLVTVVSFLSAMVFASDATLLLYYVQERLDVQPQDFAAMFLLMGVVGIIVQAGLLQPLSKIMGEHALLVASCLCGSIHNLMYALTRRKSSLYAALVVSQFTKLSFPTLSSLASKHACEHEKGRVLGALFATNAIASALGPLAMESVYNRTKDALFPGFMFVFAATLYLLGSLVAMMLPFVSRSHRVTFTGPTRSELTDPLLMTESIPSERNSTSIPNDFEAPVSIMDGETKSAFV